MYDDFDQEIIVSCLDLLLLLLLYALLYALLLLLYALNP